LPLGNEETERRRLEPAPHLLPLVARKEQRVTDAGHGGIAQLVKCEAATAGQW
jgi:hypothetical protein